MADSYDDMMGSHMDVEMHPAYNKKEPTTKYAGDVLPLPVNMGAGMLGQARNNEALKDIAARGKSAVDTTNLAVHPTIKKQ